MSVLVLLELNVKPDSADDLKNFLRDELHHTRGFDGCNAISIHSNQEDPNNMVYLFGQPSKTFSFFATYVIGRGWNQIGGKLGSNWG